VRGLVDVVGGGSMRGPVMRIDGRVVSEAHYVAARLRIGSQHIVDLRFCPGIRRWRVDQEGDKGGTGGVAQRSPLAHARPPGV